MSFYGTQLEEAIMGEMAARDDLEGQGKGIMDEERDTGMAAMSGRIAESILPVTSGGVRRYG